MHTLRQARLLARLALLWFMLSLGVAVASPMVQPRAMELVCSGMGPAKVVVHGEDGSAQDLPAHTLDCPLCLAAGAPPPVPPRLRAQLVQPLAHVPRPAVAAHIAWRTAAPLPARGPPALS
ncbi:DUF2946 domain-containing protein [Ramlibacter sp. H39-3-26]|uniref:DUF2946 family protein n=1 Tax=Curvibacter soli TaxID=3031331 RepID=UPI0023DC2B9C|nr:DUF2946 family protein [Ramlibacter sp. H39-3-26]MDF1486260.1 DUF2946 domain-containing protein [Ramlibacter sp. H39-3-26]